MAERINDLAAYVDAISDTMRCERAPADGYRCAVPVLAHWEARGSSENHCRLGIEAQVIAWIIRRHAQGEPLPPFAGIQPEITDITAQDIYTERLRLVPYTATLKAVAHCDPAALAGMLGTTVHPDWPYPAVTFDDDASEAPGDDAEGDASADAREEGLFDWLPIFWVMRDPASAPWEWMIIQRTDNVLIGEIGTSNPPTDKSDEDSIQFKYSLVPEYQNHGYMTEAARAYVAWAFTHPELTWIYATTERANLASRRVLEKIGARPFTDEDSIPEWIDWEILPEYVRLAVP